MSMDLNFWKYQNNIYLDNAVVYQKACCDQEELEGLEILPIEKILKEVAMAFHEWDSLDLFNYEREGCGSFQISTTPQMIRFDCYSMERSDMRRFSSILSEFGCQLYDPQLGMRFDKIYVFLVDEAGEYKTQVEQDFFHLFPHLEIVSKVVTWNEYVSLSKTLKHIQYNAIIHRTKIMTKVTSLMQFGNDWANRPCNCKTEQLVDMKQAHLILEELLHKSIERVTNDFFERTYCEQNSINR